MNDMNIYIETYGCSANQNNSEIMAGLLEAEGRSRYKIVSDESKADIIILNTCIVKGPTEAKEISRIKSIVKNKNKLLVVAGCLSQVAEKKIGEISSNIAILGLDNITEIVKIVDLLVKGEAKVFTERKKEIKLGKPKVNKNPIISIIQISEGCLGNCSYCSVKFAKGHLHSYPIQQIVDEVKSSVESGIKEIWLTSQDSSAYGLDIGNTLIDLLKDIMKIEGNFKIRIGMMNPDHVLPILDDLVKLYKNDKIFKFIHLPVQAGSDVVLKKMNRRYTIAEFRKIITAFRKSIPDLTIATDIICGFPEETKMQFNESLKLIEELRLDMVNISKFWLKHETSASKLRQVPSQDIKERSKKMALLFNRISAEKYKEMIGWHGTAIIDEKNERSFIARNDAYRPIVIKGEFDLGEEVNVRIVKSGTHYLIGEAI